VIFRQGSSQKNKQQALWFDLLLCCQQQGIIIGNSNVVTPSGVLPD
jgi:hypothetical protein